MSRRLLARILAAVLSGALLPIATNAASSHLPPVVETNAWVSWTAMPILITLTLIAETRKHRQPDPSANSDPDAPIAFSDGIIPLRSPEFQANAAADAYNNQRFHEAFHSYVKAVDRLHDFYAIDRMRNRQPSAQDAWIIEGLTEALGATRAIDPRADVRNGVVEATARLWDIANAATRAGVSTRIYVQGLADLQKYAPDVVT